MHPDAPYFSILLCLTSDDFTHQVDSAATQWVKLSTCLLRIHYFPPLAIFVQVPKQQNNPLDAFYFSHLVQGDQEIVEFLKVFCHVIYK